MTDALTPPGVLDVDNLLLHPDAATNTATLVLRTDALAGNAVSQSPAGDLLSQTTATATSGAITGTSLLRDIESVLVALTYLETAVRQLDDQFTAATLSAIAAHPLDFSTAFVQSFVRELVVIFVSPVTLLLGIVVWLADVTGCLAVQAAVGWGECTYQLVLSAQGTDAVNDLCHHYEQLKAALGAVQAAFGAMVDQAAEFWLHPLAWTSELLHVLETGMVFVSTVLGADSPLASALTMQMRDASTAGQVWGVIIANVVTLVGDPEETVPLAFVEVGEAVSMAASKAEAATMVTTRLAALHDEAFRSGGELSAVLKPIIVELRRAILQAGAGRGVTAAITDQRFQLGRKVTVLAKLDHAMVLALRDQMGLALRFRWGLAGSFREIDGTKAVFNLHAVVIFLLELERQGGVSISAMESIQVTALLSETVLENAHMVDKRFLAYLSKAARDLLGWHDEQDMLAILVTASQHRGSLPRYLERMDSPLPTDLNEYRSITATFRRKLIKVDSSGKPVPGEPDPGPNAIFIGPNTPASSIVKAHIDIWEQSFSHVANNQGALTKLKEVLDKLQKAGL